MCFEEQKNGKGIRKGIISGSTNKCLEITLPKNLHIYGHSHTFKTNMNYPTPNTVSVGKTLLNQKIQMKQIFLTRKGDLSLHSYEVILVGMTTKYVEVEVIVPLELLPWGYSQCSIISEIFGIADIEYVDDILKRVNIKRVDKIQFE